MKLTVELPKPFFVLAPMDDVTDTVFRRVVADCAPPDLTMTEFVNVDGLMSPGRPRLLKKIDTRHDKVPVVAQLWGKRPENFYAVTKELAATGKYAGVDLNMGCPVRAVVANGTCSALINNRELAAEIIHATREGAGTSLPLSVKTRLGFNEVDFGWQEFLLSQKLNMLTIHGRTRKELSAVPADWAAIGKVRELRDTHSPDTLIVGNGDVVSRRHGVDLAKRYALDGIMIGRGVFHDPYVFSSESPWENLGKRERMELFRRHIELFQASWGLGERPIHTLNKLCKIYINGFDGAKELRETLMSSSSADELLKILTASLPASL